MGAFEGKYVGISEGRGVGASGTYVGESVGALDGPSDGTGVGEGVGTPARYVGEGVGIAVGCFDPPPPMADFFLVGGTRL